MDWRVVCFFPMFLWGFYAVLASLAIKAHGERVTMGVEALAMLAVAVVVMFSGGIADLERVTRTSLILVILMALCSAIGLQVQFYAFRIAPSEYQGAVTMVTGLFPVVACIIFDIMGRLHINGGAAMSARQWLAAGTGTLTLWLISGK